MSRPSDPARGSVLDDLQAALDRAACLGTWMHDFRLDRFFASPALRALLGVDGRAPYAALPLARMLAGIHAEDRMRIESVMHAAGESADPFEAEFRVCLQDGGVRSLRLMGRAGVESTDGAIRIRGLAFDLTERRNPIGTPARQAHQRANQMADHATAMKSLVASLHNPPLSELVQKVAIEVGFELARRMHQVHGERPH